MQFTGQTWQWLVISVTPRHRCMHARLNAKKGWLLHRKDPSPFVPPEKHRKAQGKKMENHTFKSSASTCIEAEWMHSIQSCNTMMILCDNSDSPHRQRGKKQCRNTTEDNMTSFASICIPLSRQPCLSTQDAVKCAQRTTGTI